MKLTLERAVDGEITVSKDRVEWTPEGKLKNFVLSKFSRYAGEDTPLTKSAYGSMRREDTILLCQAGWHRKRTYHSCPSRYYLGQELFFWF